MRLDDQQFAIIENRIEQTGIDNQSLKEDLLDHIACLIEEKMEEGKSFEEAQTEVAGILTNRQIKRIELTTELLTTNAMRKHTKILGIIGLVITAAGASMKLLHLQGAYIIFLIGVIILGLGFFVSNTIDTIAKFDSSKGKTVQIIGAVGAFMTLVGGMFKMLHLPGAGVLIIMGPILLLVYFSFSSMIRTKVPE